MNLKSIAISTAIFASQFMNNSQASNISGVHVPDEMVLHIFSHLEPHQAGSIASVSQQFNRVACDSHSPIGQVNKTQDSQDLYKFCRAQRFEVGEVLALARKVIAMTKNPVPTIISETEFNKAKEYAKEVISYDN